MPCSGCRQRLRLRHRLMPSTGLSDPVKWDSVGQDDNPSSAGNIVVGTHVYSRERGAEGRFEGDCRSQRRAVMSGVERRSLGG